MNKIIFLIALFLSVGIWGCENKENKQDKCYKLYDEMLLENNFSQEGVVTYSKDYEEYVIAKLQKDGIYSKDNVYLVCPLLTKEFCKEGLKVTIKGKLFSGCVKPSSKNPEAPAGIPPTYRFIDYKITKLK